VTPYIEEHKQTISSQNPTKTEAWVTRHHLENFPSWLSEQVIGDSTIHPQLALLARGPSSTIVEFQAYDINGYTFYTRDQDRKTTHQNSGVRIDAMDINNNKNSYYGAIEEIWELEYGPLNIPLFLCQWVKLTGGGIRKVSYGPPWAHYLGGYQDRLLGGPLGLPGLCHAAPDGVRCKDYGGEVLG
jgi:hypothetical protein